MAAHGRLELISKEKASAGIEALSSGRSLAGDETGAGPISRIAKQAVPPCHYAVTRITPIGYKQHIKAADASIAISGGRKVPGNVLSLRDYAVKIKKPCIIVQFGPIDPKYFNPVDRIANWIRKQRFKTVNFAVSNRFWSAESGSRARSGLGGLSETIIFLILKVSDALSGFCNLTQVSGIYRQHTPRKSSTGRLYRHGDLLIRQIKRLPGNLRPLKSTILAAGEDTGHAHLLQPVNGSMLQVYRSGSGTRYFKTDHAILTHEEHAAMTIEKGFYSVRREREYDYFSEDDRYDWDDGYGYYWERNMRNSMVDD